VGIGRNEYIDIMNKCKAKKLLWRVNKAIVKEHLPTDPLPLDVQPWWIVHVVNLGAVPGRSPAGSPESPTEGPPSPPQSLRCMGLCCFEIKVTDRTWCFNTPQHDASLGPGTPSLPAFRFCQVVFNTPFL
jgi:FAM91 N-terminus